ncbi:LLM class flavin-dependent oxidoreductase [Mycobacterium paraseoulense]|uniref:Flavin-dependent oxidoreductase n=1 Tax=Mycobacterium paraseoulense TaxID=590652 RepID=A0A1X0IDF5_9MYCO|nr:LLM class flavin-dependent oxidoreductase [Mycobacterium paraseoulense]MCV7397139.1 LLM class flavin-dependent oxidoreductase [Mycobacterium paraseoulense]ORB43821.1 flavin-dependent oxidoreductase [Mycobacterium paraseoulense]BBZ69738.1 limonene 1,2-monooxygenase [Mycobacterium paraseoulense]
MAKLRFGYFIAPFHRAGTNPTLALQRDLQFIEHLDTLGFDEVWLGEHHSAGSEIISSPEIFIAAAAERAKRIRFGTGVISLSYHNPLWVADRLMLLDHLTHGRIIGGVGPGSLPSDSSMIGLTPTDTRELLETNLDIVVRLLAGETVSAKTATHQLFDAKLQLAPYSDGGIPLSVAAVASPTGARLAGRHGIGLLSIGATLTVEGFNALSYHWGIVEERAAAFGTQVDRKNWSLVGLFHLAETEKQAREEVKFGIEPWFRYFQKVAAFPQMTMPGEQLDEMIDVINDNGAGVIGTPERAREQVQRLWDQSGGFGCMLQMGHEWANPAATRRSAELFAAEVMPHFQGQAQPTLDAAARAGQARESLAQSQLDAVAHMTKKYQDEVAQLDEQQADNP